MREDGSIGQIVSRVKLLSRMDRQSLSETFTMNGAFYLLRWQHYLQVKRRYVDENNSYGLLMPLERSVEIDGPLDLEWARFLVKKGVVEIKNWQ
jgi:CMP-N-acetylneuraminic acid synthetase